MPNEVIKRAKSYLATLESLQALHGNSPQAQLALTVDDAAGADVLREAVDALDPDSMTPREAMDALYRLKGL